MRKKRVFPEAYCPRIVLTDVHNRKRVFEYTLEGCMVIGRQEQLCDIVLPEEPTVSKRQCRLYTEDGIVYITDLGGTNPTYLNNRRVEDDKRVQSGDVISFGEVDMYVEFK